MNRDKNITSFVRSVYSGLACFILLIVLMLGMNLEQNIQERNKYATLHTKMIENALERTFEAVEIMLFSFAEELSSTDLEPNSQATLVLRDELLQTQILTPYIRQIIVIKDDKTIIDTHNQPPKPIDNNRLDSWFDSYKNNYDKLKLGTPIAGNGFFPEDKNSSKNIIPAALEFTSQTGSKIKIIAALSQSYIKEIIEPIPLNYGDRIYINDLNGNPLSELTIPSPYQAEIRLLTHQALEQKPNRVQESDKNNFIPQYKIVTQVMKTYPVTITIVNNHYGLFLSWIQDKKSLLISIPIFIFGLFICVHLIVRNYKETLKMKGEVNLLSKVVEHTPTIVVITNAKGEIEYVNKSFEKETGYSRSEVVGQNPRVLNSGETSNQDYMTMWQSLNQGKTWFGEFHNRRKDGSLFWERASIGTLTNDDNQITHFIALKEPIDNEKAAQERLRLASIVFETTTEAIMVLNSNNCIEMINPAFKRITGYNEQEVIGNNPSLLKSGKHSAKFYQRLHTQLKENGIWEGEIWNRRKNGEIYPQWLTISSRYDQKGKLEGYVSLFSDITRRKEDEAVILRQANYDPVTNLPNRNLFQDRLSQALALSDRNRSKTALLFIDLDRFKPINDTYGHHIGDLLLQKVAKRLSAKVRKTDTIARLGGDEFAIILANLQQPYVVERIAQQVLSALSAPFYLKEHTAGISCSIGIAFYPDHCADPETLVIHADSAMYKAKQSGRNTHLYYDPILSPEYQPDQSVQEKIAKTAPTT